jgi:hypothetical protein
MLLRRALFGLISLSGVVQLMVYLIVAGLIFWLLYFLVNYINPPEPFKKIAMVILMVCAVLICIGVLLSFAGVNVVQFGP